MASERKAILHLNIALDESDQLRAQLLATRRALKRAQAKALSNLSEWYLSRAVYVAHMPNGYPKTKRKSRLCMHYARKFEREAEEMGT